MKLALVFTTILAASSATASADPATRWSQGVPQDKQDAANKLFEEGNQLFAQQAHAPALEKYTAAIKIWDHPLIRFNLAVTLIRLERPLEAAENLEQALRFGPEPFKPDLYQQALDYQILLKGRVGKIEATCAQAGANVLLDGKPWFSCPGTQTMRVLAGQHAIVGELRDYLTSSQRIVVAGGDTAKAAVKLVPLDRAVILEYPYPRAIPWAAAGVGAAIALGGLGFWLSGRSQMDQFESDFASQCPSGCEKALSDPAHRPLAQERDSAHLKGTIGITMMVAGGVVTIAGVVGAIADRPRRTLPNVEIAPTGGGGTASVGWRF